MIQSNYQSSKLKKKDLESVKQIEQFEKNLTNEQRHCTDILCTIVGVGYFMLILIISFALYNKQHYIQANFPTDSDGKLCGVDYPGYSYVFFASPTSIKQRLCVAKCPSPTDKKLQCKATQNKGCYVNSLDNFGVEFYENQAYGDRNGKFCLPTNEQAKNNLLEKSRLKDRNVYINSEDSFIMCSWLAIILAVLFGLLVQFFPKHVNQWLPYFGAAMLFILMVCTWAYSTSHTTSKVVIGIILIFALLVVILTVIRFRKALKHNGVFLEIATQFVKQYPLVLINVPIFIGIFLLFEYIIVLELNSIWTSASLSFNPEASLYWEYESGGAKFMTLLLVIQAIWIFFFIKESFNFIISGYVALWYYGNLSGNCLFPYKIYITKHIGSVFACSFMTGFFSIYDTIFDLFRSFLGQPKDSNSIYNSVKTFLDLVRSEALVYVIFTSNAYCNSARYCQYLCYKGAFLGSNAHGNSELEEVSQSVSRTYRISAYAVLGGLVSLIGLYTHGHISIYAMGLIILTTYFIINFVIQLHADSVDSLMILYLDNQEFAARKENLSGFNEKRKYMNNEKFKQYAPNHGITNKIIQIWEKNTEENKKPQCWNCWNMDEKFDM